MREHEISENAVASEVFDPKIPTRLLRNFDLVPTYLGQPNSAGHALELGFQQS